MSSSHLFLGLPIDLLVLYFELRVLGSIQQLLQTISHSVMWRFSTPISISFFFESYSSILSSHFPSFPLLHWCFFQCIQPNPLLRSRQRQFLRHCHSRMTRHCHGHCEIYRFFPSSLSSSMQLESMSFKKSLVSTLCFTIFFYLLFVCMVRRSILRCVGCIILSCSLVGAHIPDG